jgi:hypothetical protein
MRDGEAMDVGGQDVESNESVNANADVDAGNDDDEWEENTRKM